jgi:hypothetical protein
MSEAELASQHEVGELENTTNAVLQRLGIYDAAIEARISDIEAGLSPNGHSPNGLLSSALESDDARDEEKFIAEYSWALSLAAYPYRDQEAKHVLMIAATDGLFMAAETYDRETEPNFLKHLAGTVGTYMQDVFGVAPETDLPAADEFENFVLGQNTISNYPPPRQPSFLPKTRFLLRKLRLMNPKQVPRSMNLFNLAHQLPITCTVSVLSDAWQLTAPVS